MNGKKLTRSTNNRIFLGVLGGIAEYTGIDATLIRIIFLVLSWSGMSIFAYFLMAMIMPEQRDRRPSDNIQYYSSNRPRKEAKKVEDDWSDF